MPVVEKTMYEVSFKPGIRAQRIKSYLSQVPDEATFLESRDDDDFSVVLVFQSPEKTVRELIEYQASVVAPQIWQV